MWPESSNADDSSHNRQEDAKRELLSWINGTKRGSNTTSLLRGQIEEAQVGLLGQINAGWCIQTACCLATLLLV